VHVRPAGETDGPQASDRPPPPAQRPDQILGDTAYGNGPVRAELAERGIEVLAPVPEGKLVKDRFGKHDFRIDPGAATVTGPGGQTVAISVSQTGFRGATFSTMVCRDCPLKQRCCP